MNLSEMQQELRRRALPFAEIVAPFYRQLQWKWILKENESEQEYIPVASDIAVKLLELINSLTVDLVAATCGGLEAYYDDSMGDFGLRFVYSMECLSDDDTMNRKARRAFDFKTDEGGNIFVTRSAN